MNTLLPTHRDGLHDAEPGIGTTLDNLGHQAADMAIGRARSVRDHAMQVRESTVGFVQQKPIAAVLIAAAGGAAVTLLAGWLIRSSATRN